MHKRILLIEDCPEILENTIQVLSLAGYEVLTALNGKDGVEIAIKELPDLIICDITMPLLDGYGALHILSKNEETSTIPFIFLTARTERSEYRKGIEMGADDYITKPFEDIELLNAIEQRFKKIELLKRKYNKNIDGLDELANFTNGFDALKELAAQQDSLTFKKGERIYRTEYAPEGIYFIIKGKVKTCKQSADKKELITGLFKEGDFFGYLPLFEDNKYTDFAVTLEDSEISMIRTADFYALLERNEEIYKMFIKILAVELRNKEELLVNLVYNSVKKRVADALLTLTDSFAERNDENNLIIRISRENIANLAGTTTEGTIRTLSEFKKDMLINIQGALITILDYDKLKEIDN